MRTKPTRLFSSLFYAALAAAFLLPPPTQMSAQDFGGGGGPGGFPGGPPGFGPPGGGAGDYQGGGRRYRGGDGPEGGGRFGGGNRFGGGGSGRFGGGRGGFGRRQQPTERAASISLELHGMIGRGADALVSITNIETGESQWVRVRDPRAKWYVESVNPRARSAVVTMQGMSLKLEMITSTGEPMSIRPQPSALSAGDASPDGGFNSDSARLMATRMLSFDPGNPASRAQMMTIGEEMRSLAPEQRQMVFEQLREMRAGGNGPGSAGSAGGAAAPVQQGLGTSSYGNGAVQSAGRSDVQTGGGVTTGNSGGGTGSGANNATTLIRSGGSSGGVRGGASGGGSRR
ncbi:MAG: hypothetical protein LBR07_03490 [Puniceicoccales bacterium]|jgi:hypothetical protein|nr:hypothetical protein [Puniceicoccales bacterium]